MSTSIASLASIALPAAPPVSDLRVADKARSISPVVLGGCWRAYESVLLIAIGLVLADSYVGPPDLSYALIVVATSGGAVALLHLLRLYASTALASPVRHVPRVMLGWTLALALLITFLFFRKMGADVSRAWAGLWFAAGSAALIGSRLLLGVQVRHWLRTGQLYRRAVVYGGGPSCQRLLEALEADPDSGLRVCGIFDDRSEERVSNVVAGYPKLGGVDALLAFTRNTRVDLLIVALPVSAEARLLQILRRLWVLPIDIRLAAHASTLRFRPRAYSYLGNVPVIDLFDKPLADWDRVVKWGFDKAVGLAAALALAPVMALIALAIKFDSKGPVLFRQKRYGFNNELIEVFKFRSMYAEASDAHAARLVTRGDPRVTRLGRFLRKTSLDELPQLFNVLRGELSLVGPRPHALQAKAAEKLYQDVVDGYFARHKVKPGITGWAQINGWRGETDTSEKIRKRIEHDLYYIENWSVFLDLYILLRTPFALLKTEQAY